MASRYRLREGLPHPRGANWDGRGVNFSLFSAHATGVDVCIFDADGKKERERIALPEYTDEIWHGYVEGLGPGDAYGFRVHGPYAPEVGHRFNPNKLLADPYARAFVGSLEWNHACFGYTIGDDDADLSFNELDSAEFVPKSLVVDASFDWKQNKHPLVPWERTILYELHVRGYTQKHPAVAEALRGTFAGLATPEVIDYVKALGITSIELMPVQSFVNDSILLERGLTNYWGYNTIGFFAADPRYCGEPLRGVREFKEMVARFHDAGLEVILDVVYNHTAEGNELGPTLVLQGHRQRVLLPARAGPALLHQRHGHGKHAEHFPSARHPDGHGFAALLGAGDARRRLPLRPGHDPRARAERLRQPQRISQGLLAGSGAEPREAHRRALGLRPGRIPGRPIPAGLGGVERPVPRHGARLLAR